MQSDETEDDWDDEGDSADSETDTDGDDSGGDDSGGDDSGGDDSAGDAYNPFDVPAACFAVAASDGTTSNTVNLQTFDVTLFLMDHEGKRMGADPDAPCGVEQGKGAAYRLKMPDGEVRTGHADEEGKLVESGLTVASTCDLWWGRASAIYCEDDVWEEPPEPDDDDGADEYYLYFETLQLAGCQGDDDISRMLSNLGYDGDLDQQREAFAQDHGGSDDDLIAEVHNTGRECPG